MILTKEVEVNPSGKSIQYYRNLGYDAKYRQPLVVKVSDLPKGSGVMIDVLCDCCKQEIRHISYKDYMKRIEKYGDSVCSKCKPIKTKRNNLAKYGVECTFSLPEVREKVKNTNLHRYGAECSLQNEDVRQKAIDTCRSHYGVDYSIQNKEVLAKTKASLFNHYGVYHPSKSSEIREKTAQTLYKNSSQKSSTQQRYLCDLYNGILNYPISYYSADIYLSNDNFIIEYDGGGHKLNVVTGRETEEEYLRKEIIRNNIIKREGYKQMKIISSTDKLPSDDVLLKMLSDARQYFVDYPNHSWIEFDIDNSTVCNAENKNGISYDFGDLRKITQDVA